MKSKKLSRKRRGLSTREKLKELGMVRLGVHRTPRHIYAQLIDPKGLVLGSASTLIKPIAEKQKNGGNVAAAKLVGKTIAETAKKAGITKVGFDRGGNRYHGRVRALAEAAREAGLEF